MASPTRRRGVLAGYTALIHDRVAGHARHPERRAGGIEAHMGRFIWGAVAVVVAIWLFFALLRALGAIFQLLLVIAVVLVAVNIFRALRDGARRVA